MVVAGDFKNGITFDMDGQVLQVIEFQHVKPGKGAAFVRTKLKNVITGAVTERTFNPTDKFENAIVERKEMQYLYNDGDLYYFMDMETFEQIPINKDKLGDSFKFVKENEMCKIVSYKGNVFAVEPPDVRRSRSDRHRAGLQGRYRYRYHQARDPRGPARPSRFRSSSISVPRSRSIPERASTWSALKQRDFLNFIIRRIQQ